MKLLTSTHQSQRVQLIRTIDDDQFDILVEIIYNILHGICSLTKKRRRKAEKTQNTTSEIDRKENDKNSKKGHFGQHSANYTISFITLTKIFI